MKFLNIISKAISIVIGTIVIAMLVFFAIPRIMGYTPYTVITGSMEPNYHVGSMIYVKPVEFSDLKVGDAVTFSGDSYVVTHRITEIDSKNKSVVTKGDANNSIDGSIKYSSIVGRASKVSIPYLGEISTGLSTSKGKILLIIILGGLFALSYILKPNADRKEAIA